MIGILRLSHTIPLLFIALLPWKNSANAFQDVTFNMNNKETGVPVSLWFFDRFGFRRGGQYSIEATVSFAAMSGFSLASTTRAVDDEIPLFYLSICTKAQYDDLITTVAASQIKSSSTNYCTSKYYDPPSHAATGNDDATGSPTSMADTVAPTIAPTVTKDYSKDDFWDKDSNCQLVPFLNDTIDYKTYFYSAELDIDTDVPVTKELFFGITNCEAATGSQYWSSVRLRIKYLFLNPGGSLLSTEDEPKIPMNFALCVSWTVLSLLWVGATFVMRRKVDMSLHWLMATYAISKSFVMLQSYMRWLLLSGGINERESEGYMIPSFLLSRLAYYLSFGAVLLLLGKGWKLTRDNLHPMERRNTLLMVGIYTITTLTLSVWSRYRTNSTGFLSFAFLAMAYVLVLYSVWFSVTQNIMALRIHLRVIEIFGINPTSCPQYAILNMLTRFRNLYFGYLFGGAVLEIFLVAVVHDHPWVKASVSEALEIFAAIGVGITFRPRLIKVELVRLNQNNMTIEPTEAATRHGSFYQGGDDIGVGSAPTNEGLRNWQEGIPLPRNPREDLLFNSSSRREILPRDNSVKPQETHGVQMVTITNPGELHPSTLGRRQVEQLPPIAHTDRRNVPVNQGNMLVSTAATETATTAETVSTTETDQTNSLATRGYNAVQQT